MSAPRIWESFRSRQPKSMSAPRIDSKVSTDSDKFRARAAHNRALAEKLRMDVAQAALGGSEKHRERHVSRGKLLPRERVERLLGLCRRWAGLRATISGGYLFG